MLLAIDSSTSSIGIAMYDGNSIIGENTWVSTNRHTVILAPAVRQLLSTLDVDINKLKGIGIALGPGSFTSLRVGLSFAKGIALGLNIPIIGVPTLDILAASQPKTLQPLCTVLQAGRGRLAAKFYRCTKDKWVEASEIKVYSEEELAEAIQEPTTVSGELTAEVRSLLRRKNRNIRLASPSMCLRRAGFLAEIAWTKLDKGTYSNPETIAPIYLHTKDPIPG